MTRSVKSKPVRSGKQATQSKQMLGYALRTPQRLWQRNWWNKIWLCLLVMMAITVCGMYGIARWYIARHAHEPLQIGVTFVPGYARSFGLDPQQTMQAMIDDLGIKRFRLVSYWNASEPTQGTYNFDELDWQFRKAEEHGVQVSLALGLRQPRWPECHMPEWAKSMPKEQWSPLLNQYLTTVVNRYKDSPALISYQLENEYFLTVFGNCPDHSKSRLISEFNMVKKLDSSKPLIVTRSNNAVPSWPVGDPRSDINGASIYKRVWDGTITKRYFEYPIPAWFYAFLGGGAELTTGRNTFIHELQTEAWLPPGYKMNRIEDIPEQNKTFSADDLSSRLEYGQATGMRTMDLWGVEWWYWRKSVGDPSLWNTAQTEIKRFKSLD